MNPESPQDPRDEMEIRLTALLLGEVPDDQAAELRRAIDADPALTALFRRLEETIGLVRATATGPMGPAAAQPAPLRLGDERREKLLAQFKTVTPKEFASPRRRREIAWYVPMSMAAILVALIGLAVLVPGVFRSRDQETELMVTLSSAPSTRVLSGGNPALPIVSAKISIALNRLSSEIPSNTPCPPKRSTA